MMLDNALGLGFTFQDLAERDGLVRLDQMFLQRLEQAEPALHVRLLTARALPDSLPSKDESALIIDLGPHLDTFVGELFGIEPGTQQGPGAKPERWTQYTRASACSCNARRSRNTPILPRSMVPRYATRWNNVFGEPLTETVFATFVATWEAHNDADALDDALRYASWATLTPAGRTAHRGDTMFGVPRRVDPTHLVPVETIVRDGVTMLRLPEHDWRHRDGFSLTDHGMTTQGALDQIELLHLVPHPGQGFVPQGTDGPQIRCVPEVIVWRHSGGLPAGRKNQRDAHAACRRPHPRCVRDHRHR